MTLKLKAGEKFYSNKTNEYLWQEQSKGLNVEARSFIHLKFLWNYEWRKIELTTAHPFLVIAIAGKCKVPCEVSKHHLVVTGHVGGWLALHISCYKSLHCPCCQAEGKQAQGERERERDIQAIIILWRQDVQRLAMEILHSQMCLSNQYNCTS